MNRLFTTTALAALALGLPAAAQEIVELDAITVTADFGEGTETERSGASVEVSTRDDIEAAGDDRVATYLARQPGLSLSASGGPGGVWDIRIRGLHQKYVAVRIDGIDVSDPSASVLAFDFGRLGTAGLGRIEVLKGAQSAQYGSDAVAGVISLDSRRAEEDGAHASFGIEAGSYDTFSSAATVTNRGERGEIALTLSRTVTDGFSAADEADGNSEEDGFSTTRLSFNGKYRVTDALTVGFAGFTAKSDSDLDGYAPPTYAFADTGDVTEAGTRGLRLYADLETGRVSHHLEASWFVIDRATNDSDGLWTYGGERRELRYVGRAEFSPEVTLNFGADQTVERYANTSPYGDGGSDHTITGVFTELQWAPRGDLDLVATLRHDDHDAFGGHTTGRVAAAWRVRDDLILRAALATGFRAPSLYELGDPSYGNPDLSPEESRSVEIGVEKRFGGGDFVKATLFHTEIDDLIGSDPATFRYIQIPGTSTAKGIEVSGQAALSDKVTLFGAYTYTESTDPDGERQLRVPRHDLVLGVEAAIAPRWNLRAEVQHVSDFYDVGLDFPYDPVALDDYTLVNANITYAITDRAEAYLRVENLFDEDYQTVNGYGQPGQSFYAGLRARF